MGIMQRERKKDTVINVSANAVIQSPAVTVGCRLSVLRQRLFKKSPLCFEEGPVLLEHLLFQFQRSLHHRKHHCHSNRHTDRHTNKHTHTSPVLVEYFVSAAHQ